MLLGLTLAAAITITNSTNVVTNTSATASGGNAVAEVRTVVNGEEFHERRESSDGSVEITVHTTNDGSTVYGTTTAGTAATTTASTSPATIQKVLDMVKKILALFGLSINDL